jgi:hypothetical protein
VTRTAGPQDRRTEDCRNCRDWQDCNDCKTATTARTKIGSFGHASDVMVTVAAHCSLLTGHAVIVPVCYIYRPPKTQPVSPPRKSADMRDSQATPHS